MLTLETIEQIKQRLAQGDAMRMIAPDFGVSYTTIWNIAHERYSESRRRHTKTGNTKVHIQVAKYSFASLSVEEIAAQIEQDIRLFARKWRRDHPHSRDFRGAATTTAALYLQRHHELYFRDDRQAMKDAHQHWMLLMQEWFLSTVETKRKRA